MYIFIAHKPETLNTYRGCNSFYCNEFLSEHNLSEDGLIGTWSDIMLRNRLMKTDEDGFEIQIFYNGILNWKDENGCYDLPGLEPEDKALHIKHINSLYEKTYDKYLEKHKIYKKREFDARNI
jgi:hypothetical protein